MCRKNNTPNNNIISIINIKLQLAYLNFLELSIPVLFYAPSTFNTQKLIFCIVILKQ